MRVLRYFRHAVFTGRAWTTLVRVARCPGAVQRRSFGRRSGTGGYCFHLLHILPAPKYRPCIYDYQSMCVRPVRGLNTT